MANRKAGGNVAPEVLHHDTAQRYLLDYLYGRLSPELEAAMEAHMKACPWCRSEGMGHLATERMRAMQQRSSARRAGRPAPLVIGLIALLVALVGFAGLLIGVAGHEGKLGVVAARTSARTATPAVTNTPPATPTPLTLTAPANIGGAGIATLAASPDGKTLAVATNPTNGDEGGVVLYRQGKSFARLTGFEGYKAPGTLVWSPDGMYLAASGNLSLFVWQVSTGTRSQVTLPANPGTSLYAFDWANDATVSTVPASIFAATGFAQWSDKGQVIGAPAGAANVANVPALNSPIIALWGAQEGARIFRDASNTTLIGMSDSDHDAHAAFVRWSPDDHYILWGYPRLAVSSTLLGTTSMVPGGAVAVDAPDPATASAINRVGQASSANATAVLWLSMDGRSLALFDATGTAPRLEIVDATSGSQLATLANVTLPAQMQLNALSWESSNPLRVALSTGSSPAGEYGP